MFIADMEIMKNNKDEQFCFIHVLSKKIFHAVLICERVTTATIYTLYFIPFIYNKLYNKSKHSRIQNPPQKLQPSGRDQT